MRYDVIVIGGGAAGLYCAIAAGKRRRRTVVIEHNAVVGRKIIISGGGRCNFTNIHTRPENFISQNPHFCKSALARHTPEDLLDLVRKYQIPFYEKKLGQLFCRGRAGEIVDMLLSECTRARVDVQTATSVVSVEKTGDAFEVGTSRGKMHADSVVIATGGVSFAKIGATDLGYRVARDFGIAVTQTRPSLVPMVFDEARWGMLAGISVDAGVSTGSASFRENILFTHRGLSGPAILQISNYWVPGSPVSIDLMPDGDAAAMVGSERTRHVRFDNLLAQYLPQRFAEAFARQFKLDKPISRLTDSEIGSAGSLLNGWDVNFSGTEGYDRAEVTLGGVSTAELSSTTMESKKISGLYFIGEVVDVTGWLGGYNFQWAWSSGHAAGIAA